MGRKDDVLMVEGLLYDEGVTVHGNPSVQSSKIIGSTYLIGAEAKNCSSLTWPCNAHAFIPKMKMLNCCAGIQTLIF
jgi:hypothetical protein